MRNLVKERLRRGEQTVGAWITIPCPDVPEALSTLGFDWFVFDTEHAPMDEQIAQDLMTTLRGTKVAPLVRVAWNDPVRIKRALDIGSYGLIIPWVNNREQALAAVKACKYPPAGIRGVGPRRPTVVDPSYLETADEELLTVVQIETAEAVEKIHEILSVDGVDAFFIGPMDLSASLGIMGQYSHPRLQKAIDKVFEAGKKAGVASGIWTGAGKEVKERLDQGFQFVALGLDLGFVVDGARAALKAVGR